MATGMGTGTGMATGMERRQKPLFLAGYLKNYRKGFSISISVNWKVVIHFYSGNIRGYSAFVFCIENILIIEQIFAKSF